MIKYILYFSIFALIRCNRQSEVEFQPYIRYFQDSTIAADTALVNALIKVNEPIIFKSSEKSDTYRLIYLSSVEWGLSGVARMECDKGDSLIWITAKILPANLKHFITNSFELTGSYKILKQVNYWDSLQNKLIESDFFNQLTYDNQCGEGVFDGGTYIIEARMGDRYNCIVRTNPTNDPRCEKGMELKKLISFSTYLLDAEIRAFQSHYQDKYLSNE